MTKSSRLSHQYVAERVGFVDVGNDASDLPDWMDEDRQRKDRALQVGSLRPPALPPAVGQTLQYDEPSESDELPAADDGDLFRALNAMQPGRGRNATTVALAANARKLEQEPPSIVDVPRPEARSNDTLIDDLLRSGEQEAQRQLAEAIQGFWQGRTQLIEQTETQLVQLVATICRRVLVREVSLDPNLVQTLVREGLAALGEADQVIVRLGPYFAEVAESLADSLQASGIKAQVIIDELAKSYACTLETELGDVDESLEARLQALIEDATYARVSGAATGR